MEVVEYLIDNGIETYRLVAKGYGESDPISDNDTEKDRAQNRRTEFMVIK
jgi:outer membrane protein OmpA-like peptidoglycan-associated protein